VQELRSKAVERVRKSRQNARERALEGLPVRVTKGSRPLDLLPGIKYNSRWGRHYRRTQRELLIDRGGIENSSAAQVILARHAAAIECELYLRLVKMSLQPDGASDKDFAAYQTGLNGLRRALECLGLQRQPRELPTDGEVVEGTSTVVDDQIRPDLVRRELERRAFQGSDSLLAQLHRSHEQKERDETEAGPKLVVLFEPDR
jgi:hypothetical protein